MYTDLSERVPDYVWDILEAWLLDKPLDFRSHDVPVEIQLHLANAVHNGVLGKVPRANSGDER